MTMPMLLKSTSLLFSLLRTQRAKWHEKANRHLALLLSAALFLIAISSSFAQTPDEEEEDEQDKPWQETPVQLPAPPLEQNLLPFEVSATATQSFAIDAKSITVGTDGVVRYTLVARSSSGAKTVNYEGIRCQSFEKKLYAAGHPDGTWSRSRRNRWEPITRNVGNRQHAVLALDYFCDNVAVAGNAQTIIDRLRWQRPLPNRTTGSTIN